MRLATLIEHPTLIADASHTAQTLTRLAGEYRVANAEAGSLAKTARQTAKDRRDLEAAAILMRRYGVAISNAGYTGVATMMRHDEEDFTRRASDARREARDAKAALLAAVLETF